MHPRRSRIRLRATFDWIYYQTFTRSQAQHSRYCGDRRSDV